MAVDRVADNGKGANKILAVESGRRDPSAQTGGHRQTTLAHRARIRGTEAGTWPGTFRRPELARLSSSCNPIHRCLWLPGSGAVPFSPLRQLAATPSGRHPASRPPYALRLHPPRRSPCAQNGIILDPLPPCDATLPPNLPALCQGVLAVCTHICNTVVLVPAFTLFLSAKSGASPSSLRCCACAACRAGSPACRLSGA